MANAGSAGGLTGDMSGDFVVLLKLSARAVDAWLNRVDWDVVEALSALFGLNTALIMLLRGVVLNCYLYIPWWTLINKGYYIFLN